jgi:hypothetical protein
MNFKKKNYLLRNSFAAPPDFLGLFFASKKQPNKFYLEKKRNGMAGSLTYALHNSSELIALLPLGKHPNKKNPKDPVAHTKVAPGFCFRISKKEGFFCKATLQTSIQSVDDIKKPSVFYNYTFDKGRLKSLVSWSLKTYGEYQTIKLLESLKKTGFGYATKAGISLGIEDLKIPPKKGKLLYEAEEISKKAIDQYNRSEITGVERFQRLIDTWHRTSEQLKQEVIAYFEKTDILNPVYMMAFSGARGNISQVRQLVGMRGLMADAKGQIIDYPIRSNFREGLTITEYIISSYGARKGIVDTALRTANAGYLTRRLVDVAQHVVISDFDCGTNKGIFLNDMKEGNKTIYSLQSRLIGRVLARDLSIPSNIKDKENTNELNVLKKLALRNQEITSDLAFEISKYYQKVFVRSPLTCSFGEKPLLATQKPHERKQRQKQICQLCYGWSLAQGKFVSIGEAVGIVAAQSIGEPGTQLTMRTFHTGGVFSGDISDQIRAPYKGFISYQTYFTGAETMLNNTSSLTLGETSNLNATGIAGTLIRTPEGLIAFLTKTDGLICVYNETHSLETAKKWKIPAYTILYYKTGQEVLEKQVIAQISTIARQQNMRDDSELTVKSEIKGQFFVKTLQIQENLISSQKQTKKNADAADSIYSMDLKRTSWDWGYAWVLSCQLYKIPILSSYGETKLSLLPQTGDFVDKNSIMTQIQWFAPQNGGYSIYLQKDSSFSNTTVSNLQNTVGNKLIQAPWKKAKQDINSQTFAKTTASNYLQTPNKIFNTVWAGNLASTSLKKNLLSLDIKKISYKKIGYFLEGPTQCSTNISDSNNLFIFLPTNLQGFNKKMYNTRGTSSDTLIVYKLKKALFSKSQALKTKKNHMFMYMLKEQSAITNQLEVCLAKLPLSQNIIAPGAYAFFPRVAEKNKHNKFVCINDSFAFVKSKKNKKKVNKQSYFNSMDYKKRFYLFNFMFQMQKSNLLTENKKQEGSLYFSKSDYAKHKQGVQNNNSVFGFKKKNSTSLAPVEATQALIDGTSKETFKPYLKNNQKLQKLEVGSEQFNTSVLQKSSFAAPIGFKTKFFSLFPIIREKLGLTKVSNPLGKIQQRSKQYLINLLGNKNKHKLTVLGNQVNTVERHEVSSVQNMSIFLLCNRISYGLSKKQKLRLDLVSSVAKNPKQQVGAKNKILFPVPAVKAYKTDLGMDHKIKSKEGWSYFIEEPTFAKAKTKTYNFIYEFQRKKGIALNFPIDILKQSKIPFFSSKKKRSKFKNNPNQKPILASLARPNLSFSTHKLSNETLFVKNIVKKKYKTLKSFFKKRPNAFFNTKVLPMPALNSIENMLWLLRSGTWGKWQKKSNFLAKLPRPNITQSNFGLSSITPMVLSNHKLEEAFYGGKVSVSNLLKGVRVANQNTIANRKKNSNDLCNNKVNSISKERNSNLSSFFVFLATQEKQKIAKTLAFFVNQVNNKKLVGPQALRENLFEKTIRNSTKPLLNKKTQSAKTEFKWYINPNPRFYNSLSEPYDAAKLPYITPTALGFSSSTKSNGVQKAAPELKDYSNTDGKSNIQKQSRFAKKKTYVSHKPSNLQSNAQMGSLYYSISRKQLVFYKQNNACLYFNKNLHMIANRTLGNDKVNSLAPLEAQAYLLSLLKVYKNLRFGIGSAAKIGISSYAKKVAKLAEEKNVQNQQSRQDNSNKKSLLFNFKNYNAYLINKQNIALNPLAKTPHATLTSFIRTNQAKPIGSCARKTKRPKVSSFLWVFSMPDLFHGPYLLSNKKATKFQNLKINLNHMQNSHILSTYNRLYSVTNDFFNPILSNLAFNNSIWKILKFDLHNPPSSYASGEASKKSNQKPSNKLEVSNSRESSLIDKKKNNKTILNLLRKNFTQKTNPYVAKKNKKKEQSITQMNIISTFAKAKAPNPSFARGKGLILKSNNLHSGRGSGKQNLYNPVGVSTTTNRMSDHMTSVNTLEPSIFLLKTALLGIFKQVCFEFNCLIKVQNYKFGFKPVVNTEIQKHAFLTNLSGASGAFIKKAQLINNLLGKTSKQGSLVRSSNNQSQSDTNKENPNYYFKTFLANGLTFIPKQPDILNPIAASLEKSYGQNLSRFAFCSTTAYTGTLRPKSNKKTIATKGSGRSFISDRTKTFKTTFNLYFDNIGYALNSLASTSFLSSYTGEILSIYGPGGGGMLDFKTSTSSEAVSKKPSYPKASNFGSNALVFESKIDNWTPSFTHKQTILNNKNRCFILTKKDFGSYNLSFAGSESERLLFGSAFAKENPKGVTHGRDIRVINSNLLKPLILKNSYNKSSKLDHDSSYDTKSVLSEQTNKMQVDKKSLPLSQKELKIGDFVLRGTVANFGIQKNNKPEISVASLKKLLVQNKDNKENGFGLLNSKRVFNVSGQIIHWNFQKVTIRKAQPFFVTANTTFHAFQGGFVQSKEPVITLIYQKLKTGDIIQGIPKVEQFFEARTTKRGRLFRDNLPNLLKGLFLKYYFYYFTLLKQGFIVSDNQAQFVVENKQEKNKSQIKDKKKVGPQALNNLNYAYIASQWAVKQSFYKIQQIAVDGVLRVYRSQGVTISDKHLEIIVKQMTTKVRIIRSGQTALFPGEIVDLHFIETLNEELIRKAHYEPMILGITKASLHVDSFLSSASFQQTSKILSQAALINKKDYLKGVKENVLLGNLIPAGTGYLVSLEKARYF